VEELRFQFLDRSTGTLLQEAQCEELGFHVPWESRFSGATYRVAGYSFPLFSGESGIITV
jgi:hypothetical protein